MHGLSRAGRRAQGPGKRVGGSLYVHRGALELLSAGLRAQGEAAMRAAGPGADRANVLRFDADGRTALLAYPRFDDDPFPPLAEAWLVKAGGRVRHRLFRDNPPILHRKELLLAPDDPRRQAFAHLTAELEARGLFRDARRIGRRRAWDERLAAAGVRVEDHRVMELEQKG